MNRVRSITYFVRIATFTGPLIVLDTQSSFDNIFGLNPIMNQKIPRRKRQCTTEETEYLSSKVLFFGILYRLHIFYNYIQLKYVGIIYYNSQKMLADFSLALSNLKMVYNHRERTLSLTPDNLLSPYIEFFPLLSPNALTWSFSLIKLFLMLCLSSCRNHCNSGAIVYLILHVYLLLFCRNRC